MPRSDDIKKLISIHNRRLQNLREQKAFQGISADPKISQEIEDIEAEIAELYEQLTEATSRLLRDPVPDFTGREQEINDLVQVLEQATERDTVAICGVRGMGGVGKSEFALAVAQRTSALFPDGQLLVELRGTSNNPISPTIALQNIIYILADRETSLPDNLASLQGIYYEKLRGKRVLIVADDAKDAAQAKPLIPPKGCALLITTRQRFTLPGLFPLDLDGLPFDQAEALLLTICPRIGSIAERLAHLCGALPLALRVSASLLANDDTYNVDRFLSQLEASRLDYLRDPDMPDDPTASVEASLRLSYDVLDPHIQKVLCQISVFPSSFDLAAAEAIVEEHEEYSDIKKSLGLLRRRNLVEWDATVERYNLHDLVRAFATARLVDADVHLRYAQHYAKVALRVFSLYEQGQEATYEGFALFDRERTHIDAGWAWARERAGISSAVDELLLAYARGTGYIGTMRYNPRHERLPQLTAALEAARRLQRPYDEARSLNVLGHVYMAIGEIHKAIKHYEEALVIRRAIGARKSEGTALGNLGTCYHQLGDVERAIEYYEQHLKIAREVGNQRGEQEVLNNLGTAYADMGNESQAIEYYRTSIEVARDMQNIHGEAIASWHLGRLLEKRGDLVQALPLMQLCVDFYRKVNHRNAKDYATHIEQVRQRLQNEIESK